MVSERDKLLATIKETLEALKPGYGKKADDDDFVVGRSTWKTIMRSVEFLVKQGVQQTAQIIADFVVGKGPDPVRQWRAFARAKTMKAAKALRAKAKSQSVKDQLAAFKLNTAGKNRRTITSSSDRQPGHH